MLPRRVPCAFFRLYMYYFSSNKRFHSTNLLGSSMEKMKLPFIVRTFLLNFLHKKCINWSESYAYFPLEFPDVLDQIVAENLSKNEGKTLTSFDAVRDIWQRSTVYTAFFLHTAVCMYLRVMFWKPPMYLWTWNIKREAVKTNELEIIIVMKMGKCTDHC